MTHALIDTVTGECQIGHEAKCTQNGVRTIDFGQYALQSIPGRSHDGTPVVTLVVYRSDMRQEQGYPLISFLSHVLTHFLSSEIQHCCVDMERTASLS